MQSYLKIKIKSLAAEAMIIRHEERRVIRHRRHLVGRQGDEKALAALNAEQEGLYLHRIRDVRGEARAAQLAYAYLRGRHPYAKVEPAGSVYPPLGRIVDLVAKYGGHDKKLMAEPVKAWIDQER